MKKTWLKCAAFVLAAALVSPVALKAQDDKEKDKESKNIKEKKEVQQIIITRKSEKDEKVVVEINGDKVTINGKSIEEYKNSGGDINVRTNKVKDMEYLTRIPNVSGTWNFNGDGHANLVGIEANRAMLGVTTDNNDKGAVILSITKESAASKIGLKEGDIITNVDGKKIATPDELTTAIRSHKPGDKVEVTYLRDNKEQKANTELTGWKSQDFKMDMGDMNWGKVMPNIQTVPGFRTQNGQLFSYNGNTPKLGLSVQDTDDGKGVKVIEVDSESNAAKAGLKLNDVVTEVDSKAINSTDEMVKSMKENKEKVSVMFKVIRDGKTQNVEVKMPRKIQTKDL